MMNLPQDPMMLFSVINMKLRDQYSSLDELCEDMDVNRKELEDKLAEAILDGEVKAGDEVVVHISNKEVKFN